MILKRSGLTPTQWAPRRIFSSQMTSFFSDAYLGRPYTRTVDESAREVEDVLGTFLEQFK